MSLEALLERGDLWRGGGHAEAPVRATGHPRLDHALGGGWPIGGLVEIAGTPGHGEFTLLRPMLAAAVGWQAWVAPPHVPHAPALVAAGLDPARLLHIRAEGDEALWAVEQALRSGVCEAVLGWPATADDRALRRLQLAAETGGATGFLFRPPRALEQPSPAAVRLALRAGAVAIHKCRGNRPEQPIPLGEALDETRAAPEPPRRIHAVA
ncbi:cell division inhibitor SulA [Thiohalospira halophila DSM 15071]|uniref:Cell division inhibitor SulA n=1 Tax=Thiohalospira halophila DSM 15071 TaxID=1123397 RepID=A0A1I1NXC4_9GAMM|nr:translesion DNA synthesis-associated protein ImuA [Thiohalospira halophila]SFD02105.1 cell division inhibitor SulA [Thiohalospira halophila DSM 15071]